MIYTIGNYDPQYIADAAPDKVGHKVGYNDTYPGGIAFLTLAEATAYRDQHYPKWSVFGLECDWSNTWLDPELGAHRIIHAARIVCVVDWNEAALVTLVQETLNGHSRSSSTDLGDTPEERESRTRGWLKCDGVICAEIYTRTGSLLGKLRPPQPEKDNG